MFNYQRIQKDCSWDLNFTSDDDKQLNILFEKILLNSTALFQDNDLKWVA